jgi:hypothetical protein
MVKRSINTLVPAPIREVTPAHARHMNPDTRSAVHCCRLVLLTVGCHIAKTGKSAWLRSLSIQYSSVDTAIVIVGLRLDFPLNS